VNGASVMGKVGQFNVCFRAEQLTSHAGVVLVHELAQQLGVEQRLEEEREGKQRERGYCEGQALGAWVYTLLLVASVCGIWRCCGAMRGPRSYWARRQS